jgi:calcineurin-like phosphoesterase family protein
VVLSDEEISWNVEMKKIITDLRNTYLTSDNHFYHQNIIRYCNRPFQSVEEMNEVMIAKWNETVMPSDTIYHLGDFSMAFRSVELFTKRLNGNKILIAGNHDLCHPGHKKSRNPENCAEWIGKYIDNGWAEVHTSGEFEIPGVLPINVNHMPYLEGSGQDVRHAKFRPNDDGRWLLCGHVHEKWAQRGKMINVGVDVRNFRPTSFQEIVDLISAAPQGYPKPPYKDPTQDY